MAENAGASVGDDGSSFLQGFDFWNTDTAAQPAGGGAAAAGASGAGVGAVAGQAGGGQPAPGGSGGGGGFAMSGDEMHSMLEQAKQTRKLIQEQLLEARSIALVQPPGHDQTSTKVVNGPNGVNDVGQHYLGHLKAQENRYTQLIDKLSQALGLTEETDQQAGDAAKKAGGDPTGSEPAGGQQEGKYS